MHPPFFDRWGLMLTTEPIITKAQKNDAAGGGMGM